VLEKMKDLSIENNNLKNTLNNSVVPHPQKIDEGC
jgi:hypothetical protein